MGDTARPKGAIDWTAINLAASIALPLELLFHAGFEILRRIVPPAVQSAVSPLTLFSADHVLSYGLPFASAFLLIRALDLATPLRAAPIVAWILLLCSLALHVDRAGAALALQVLIPAGALGLIDFAIFTQLPLPARQAVALGMAAAWLWVACGFVGALLRGGATWHLPTRPDVAVAFVAGIALPAAALAPLLPVAVNYRDLYAAQETRFRQLCKDVKEEIFGAARSPKGVFFDPNESLSCWHPHDGQCQAMMIGDRIAQYIIINWQLEFVEFWEKAEPAKTPALMRCTAGDKCQPIASVAAAYRVVTRETQSKADEAIGLRQRVITVDEREAGRVLGRLQFVYSTETYRLCAPGAEDGRDFDADAFIVRALGVEPRKQRYQ